MDRRVVTPEAVALDLQTATVATRGLAQLLDVVLQGITVLLMVAAMGLADLDSSSGAVFMTVVLLGVFLIRVAYPVVMETRFGATLGHMALGLRVVTVDGAPIRARQAVTRVAVGLFEIDATLGALALLVAASRRDGRRLGDLAAGTQVVSVRVGTGPATALEVEVPTRLRGWATSVDASGLAQAERTALRRYLARAGDLPPERRDQLAADLADRLLPRVGASRPANTPAHDVLLAVAAVAADRPASPGHPTPSGRSTPPGEPAPPAPEQRSDRPPPPPPGASPRGSSPFEPPR